MPRLARVVVPDVPHYVAQRGNLRQETFFCEDDYQRYLALMAEWCGERQVEVWAYCLMPNHVHMIAVPRTEDALGRAIGEAHRRYTRYVNLREGWRGYLWQGRFASFPMDEAHLYVATRYVELNPVRAGLASEAAAYQWSSARAHVAGQNDGLVKVGPLSERFGDWRGFLGMGVSDRDAGLLRLHERTGRPLGSARFVARLENLLNRVLRPRKPGRKRKAKRRASVRTNANRKYV